MNYDSLEAEERVRKHYELSVHAPHNIFVEQEKICTRNFPSGSHFAYGHARVHLKSLIQETDRKSFIHIHSAGEAFTKMARVPIPTKSDEMHEY